MSKQRPRGPSQRQLRVGEEVRHLLSRILNDGEANDPRLHDANITVTEVRVSPDLKNATAFVLPLGGSNKDEIFAALKTAAPFYRRRLADVGGMKFTPRLSFQVDQSFDTFGRVDEILRRERVQQDLHADENEEEVSTEEADHGAAS